MVLPGNNLLAGFEETAQAAGLQVRTVSNTNESIEFIQEKGFAATVFRQAVMKPLPPRACEDECIEQDEAASTTPIGCSGDLPAGELQTLWINITELMPCRNGCCRNLLAGHCQAQFARFTSCLGCNKSIRPRVGSAAGGLQLCRCTTARECCATQLRSCNVSACNMSPLVR